MGLEGASWAIKPKPVSGRADRNVASYCVHALLWSCLKSDSLLCGEGRLPMLLTGKLN